MGKQVNNYRKLASSGSKATGKQEVKTGEEYTKDLQKHSTCSISSARWAIQSICYTTIL